MELWKRILVGSMLVIAAAWFAFAAWFVAGAIGACVPAEGPPDPYLTCIGTSFVAESATVLAGLLGLLGVIFVFRVSPGVRAGIAGSSILVAAAIFGLFELGISQSSFSPVSSAELNFGVFFLPGIGPALAGAALGLRWRSTVENTHRVRDHHA
jgi:hypothetical protein